MKRRKLVTSMVALGVVAGLLGGGIQSQAADGEKKKVTLWTWATGQFDAVQEAYFASHPDADWEFEEVVVASEDYLTKLQQGYASGGDMPDLLMAEEALLHWTSGRTWRQSLIISTVLCFWIL